jgi:hypothetical protein
MDDQARAAFVEKLTKDLTDKGLLIEAGFVSLRHTAMAKDAPAEQVDEMRIAFFAGAQHLFGSIMSILDPGEEPTLADLQRMDLIQRELDRFIKDYSARHGLTEGRT